MLFRSLGALPASTDGVEEPLARTAQYLRRCTTPTDRLVVADNLPEVYYFANRRVGAGQYVFFGGFYTETAAQQETLARWRQQEIPIVLVQPASRFDDEFGSDYPILADYLRGRYQRAGSIEVRRGMEMDVWIDPGRDQGRRDSATGLPCLTE